MLGGEGRGYHRTGGDSIMPRKPRRRSWGSIREVTRGKKYVLRWVENTRDGRVRRCETFYGTYREANKRLDEIHVMHGDDRPVPTIGQVYELWYLPDLERRVAMGKAKSSTAATYQNIWANHVRPAWGNTPVDSVHPADVQEWLLSLPKTTAVTAISVVRAVMDIAVRYELTDRNRFREKYTMPSDAMRTRSRGTYSLGEADEVLSKLEGNRIEGAYIAACFGSCRTGESLGIRADEVELVDIDGLDMCAVHIVRRAGNRNEVLSDGDLKNAQSVRHIIVPGAYARRLNEVAEKRRRDGYTWLTSAPDGLPMGTDLLNREWRMSCPGEYIPFANLRNSWRTFAQLEWGIDWDTLEKLMGHTLPGVSGKHYVRPSVEQLCARFAELYRGTR